MGLHQPRVASKRVGHSGHRCPVHERRQPHERKEGPDERSIERIHQTQPRADRRSCSSDLGARRSAFGVGVGALAASQARTGGRRHLLPGAGSATETSPALARSQVIDGGNVPRSNANRGHSARTSFLTLRREQILQIIEWIDPMSAATTQQRVDHRSPLPGLRMSNERMRLSDHG